MNCLQHDAFLITENAVHFNSTATIYIRQALAIEELAKKVFHVLKSSPDDFELEFSETRQRSGRRAQGEAGWTSSSEIARKRLLGCFQMHESQAPLASTSSQLAPRPLSNVFTSPPSQDKPHEHPSAMKNTGEKGSLSDEMGIQGPTVGRKVQCNEIHGNQRNEIQLDSSLKAHHT
ncbi:hypothetical protein DVH24_036385 [Malus domestica]|uniref:Bromo domain-containing protein n=1 Tax=Malus domestica TaxID=3750 RepID=A0A498IIQ5_MALDO|nr:hypothetical protein DVH24_036385 [Malus domestica]